ncbi:putative disease resistance RPP13-like protein 2 [Bidens hawaiensis]|uniref:putative disease resistance RPP13-like protein 2 n=1 Tax=Bidens hawaiensis TaxID=980011 RepID=UPI00404A0385
MEVNAVLALLILKLQDTLNEESIAKKKLLKSQLKLAQKSLEKVQNLSDDFDKSQKSRDYLRLLYEVEDEIEKFTFRVARQRKRFGLAMKQTFLLNKLNSCRMLIRKLNNLITNNYYFTENHKPVATPRITSSSSVCPIPIIPSPKRGHLTRSFTTITRIHPQKKELTFSFSYNNKNVLPHVNDNHCSNEAVAKRYNDLHTDLKPCLLYLTLFPKDFNIPVRRLLRLWLAEGFVERKPSREDIAQKHFEDLVDQVMIQITKLRSDNSPKQCCLVPVFYDYLLPKAKEINMFSIHHNPEHIDNVADSFGERRMIHQMGPATGVLTNSNSVCGHKFNPSLLRSYVSFNRPRKDMPAKEVGPLLGRVINSDFRLLQVLDLEGVNKPTLPNKLDHLYLLKYLGLRGTWLDNLPESVGKLRYLETLDLKHTNINSLPDSIWKHKRLRHLNLNNIRLTMPSSSSSTLVTLWGLVLDDKISVNELEGLTTLHNLRELGIKFQLSIASQGVLLDWIKKLTDLQSLRLFSLNGSQALTLVLKTLATLNKLSHLNLCGNLERLPAANEFPPTVKVLTLSISLLNKDPMETLGQLPSLMVLRLLAESFTGKRMVCVRGGFKKLEVLKMWKLQELEEWEVEEEAMEGLKELDIRGCHKLRSIPCRLVIKPRRLETLKLTDMPDEFVDRITKRISTNTTLVRN